MYTLHITCFSTGEKCVLTTGKNRFYNQNYVFPLLGNIFPLSGKIVLTGKINLFLLIMFPNYVSNIEKRKSFTDTNMGFLWRKVYR